MLEKLAQLLNPNAGQKKAENSFARLMSQTAFEGMPYREGVKQTRRRVKSQTSAIGVWLIPSLSDASMKPDFTRPIPAVTFDLRHMGVGVLMRQPLDSRFVVIAIPDNEDVWRLFECEVRHQSQRPGGWLQVGLKLRTLFDASMAEITLLKSHFAQVPIKEETCDSRCW